MPWGLYNGSYCNWSVATNPCSIHLSLKQYWTLLWGCLWKKWEEWYVQLMALLILVGLKRCQTIADMKNPRQILFLINSSKWKARPILATSGLPWRFPSRDCSYREFSERFSSWWTCKSVNSDFNPYAAGGFLVKTKWCKKTLKNDLTPWHMGNHLIVPSISYPMNTNMTGFRWFSIIFASLCFGLK